MRTVRQSVSSRVHGSTAWLLVALLLAASASVRAQVVVVRDVALVDPDRIAPARATLVLRDGAIAAVAPAGSDPRVAGALEIDGRDLFAMPGSMPGELAG